MPLEEEIMAQQSHGSGHKKYRFRKRDKVSSFSRNTIGLGQGKGRGQMNRKEIMILAKKFSKILRLKKDPSQPMLQKKGPPKSFFEEDGAEFEDGDHRIPSEVLYMLRSVRVFGHFEKPLFLELCRHMESKFVPAGSYLFRIGDQDDCIYVVQSGKINVYISEGGSDYLVKEVGTGDSIHSLLSILDFITGKPQPYKTVSGRAVVDSTILKMKDASIMFVVSGKLSVLQHYVGETAKEVKLFSAQPGEIVGALAVLTGEPSFFTIRSKIDSRVVTISKSDFYLIMREQPSVVLNVASTTLIRLTPFVRQIDFALDWMMIEAGRALFRQGDHSDSIYIVLTGRLRTVITLSGGKKELVGEYGRGELVGIVEVLTQQERVTTGIAVRDTELAKLPSELLNVIKRKYPQVVTRLIHLLGTRIIGNMRNKDTLHISESMTNGGETRGSVTNLATVAILPASSDVPLTNFTLELQHALKAIGPVTSVNEFRLFSWLGQQEDIHRMILYQCDYTMTKWTKMCIRQADAILIVGMSGNDHKVGELEQQMETIDVRAQKELVLLHREDADYPRGTVDWLNAQADRMSDMSRLARFLTGTSVGLVLGASFNEGIEATFKDRQIEDLWIPFFCITTDLNSSQMRVHTHGSLWRYVRASMSLAGYLPPLCDPVDGHLLLDGGYVNNLPADVMRSFGAQSIFAVDVGSQDDTELTNYGDKLSGWWLLWKRWNPWAEPVRVPDMQEIQSRLAYVSCIRQLEIEVGYNHGKTMLSGWEKGGLIKQLFHEKKSSEHKMHAARQDQDMLHPHTPRLAYFTDLAELVSKIDEPRSSESLYEAEDEDYSDSYDEDEVILDTNQHAQANVETLTSNVPIFGLHDIHEDDDGDEADDDDDDDDDDDQYVTESEGDEEEENENKVLKDLQSIEFGRMRGGEKRLAKKSALPRRLSGFLKK
ncbi:PLPL7-like protein [Mya arenaria]|uniref:PLPL7-like protein n=1 Tax=Mya arenaria TaxID=6604 RepID=A0ABY7FFI9_MYAAR|nr:PLPL7-like protein [Mya arenaria]